VSDWMTQAKVSPPVLPLCKDFVFFPLSPPALASAVFVGFRRLQPSGVFPLVSGSRALQVLALCASFLTAFPRAVPSVFSPHIFTDRTPCYGPPNAFFFHFFLSKLRSTAYLYCAARVRSCLVSLSPLTFLTSTPSVDLLTYEQPP